VRQAIDIGSARRDSRFGAFPQSRRGWELRVARILAVVAVAGFGVTACVKPPPPPPPVTLADLNSSFSGTQSFEFGTHGCSFVFQIFEADYRQPNILKEIELHIEGCVSDDIRTYTGTFTIDTDAGTVSGTTSGFVIGGGAEFEFNLAPRIRRAWRDPGRELAPDVADAAHAALVGARLSAGTIRLLSRGR
jgi:hypothetical protein